MTVGEVVGLQAYRESTIIADKKIDNAKPASCPG